MTATKAIERHGKVVKTIHCATPYCYGFQDVHEDGAGVGSCRCGWLVDDDEFDAYLATRATPTAEAPSDHA